MKRAALALLLVVSARAHAGDFCGSMTGPEAVRALEAYAAGKGAHVNWDCFEQSYGDPLPAAVQARILAACTKAVTLPPAKRSGYLDPSCVIEVLAAGSARVGDRDLVGEKLDRKWAWDDWAPYASLAATGDARVRPFVLAQLAAHRETWRKKHLRAAWARDTWSSHVESVLDALAKVGAAEDLPLIAELEAADPKDRRVAKAAQRARAAIEARR